MNTFTRTLMILCLALAVVACNENEPVNPAESEDATLQKKPSTPLNSGPVIKSVTPAAAEVGDEIVIKGSDFGTKYQYASNYVLVHGVKARVYTLWSKTEIRLIAPSGSTMTTGPISVTVHSIMGNEVSFTYLPSSPVTIGSQTWAGANLDVEYYASGDPIPHIADSVSWANATTGAWCWYDFDPDMGKRVGKLYNWYAVNDPRGLAPLGQHIPTDAEWTQLAVALGASYAEASQAIGWFGSDEGGKLKNVGNGMWSVPNEGATNSSGFNALPGGCRSSNGGFFGVMYYGYWIYGLYGYYWTKTEQDPSIGTAWMRALSKDEARIARSYAGSNMGMSVRTIYDN